MLSKRTVSFLLTIGLIVGWTASIGQASSPFTPEDLLKSMQKSFEELKDYQCEMLNTSYKPERTKTDSNKYYFKKPSLIRLEVTGGSDKGAVAVYNSKGKVRAKAGGILGLFTITMEPSDKRLRDKDGSTFVDSHLGGTIKEIMEAVKDGKAAVTEIERGRKLLQLQIDREGKRDIILINPQLMLPVEWLAVREGRPRSKTEWRNLRVNVGLQDSLFQL